MPIAGGSGIRYQCMYIYIYMYIILIDTEIAQVHNASQRYGSRIVFVSRARPPPLNNKQTKQINKTKQNQKHQIRKTTTKQKHQICKRSRRLPQHHTTSFPAHSLRKAATFCVSISIYCVSPTNCYATEILYKV